MRSYQQLTARSELIDLYEDLSSRKNDNSMFLNAINFALLSLPTLTKMFIYRFGDVADPYYLAVHEPNICITPPISGHHQLTLDHLTDELFNTILPEIAPDTTRFFLDSDTKTPSMIRSSSFSIDYTTVFQRFYMNEEQRQQLRKMTITAPAGYYISDIDAGTEYDEIHDAWAYGKQMDRELTRQQLLHLPSSCIRAEDGSLVSWELSHHFMKMSNHFTYPSHRGKGLGVLTELLIAQRYVESGYRPFKGVSDANEGVIRGTKASPHWSDGEVYGWSVLRKKE
ncbi:hypothetical protein PRIPAC_83569 [Pristionchus pacificus]|uniref:Glycine N-acyltransferase-like protein n=1 Tax=Pristionchus pacificus TaxID=54126 RepID=A0A2A6CEW7_PRIPA|nr:hypothetical protein PRIPAC_83569 [Pristionchus pacificus]|eukprot:PDM76551.1 hypothetical protein PRIPAC_42917 [Pristionchus pacificus]